MRIKKKKQVFLSFFMKGFWHKVRIQLVIHIEFTACNIPYKYAFLICLNIFLQ